jgi:hypothetical protein
VAGVTRNIVLLVIIAFVTAAGYFSIEGWRNAILGAGIAAATWVVSSRLFRHLGRFRQPRGSLFDRALHVSDEGPGRPADLEAVERLFGWRTYAPDEFDKRIRPSILRLVERRLMDRRGIDPTTDPERAREHLGPELQALLLERAETGADTQRLSSLIDEVEAI